MIPVEPKVVIKAIYTWTFGHLATDNGVLASGSRPGTRVLVTRVEVTVDPDVNDDDDGDGSPYIDFEAWGYQATAKGKRDKRSGHGRVYPDFDWRKQFETDALARYASL